MSKVSVIVPTYNVDKYLKECIESIQNQVLSDIEIIIVNDGSSDNSLHIAKSIAENDSRVVIINKENGGYGSAMAAGLEKAKGEYIGIVDSDDNILPNMYSTLYPLAKQYDLDIAGSAYIKFYNKSDGQIYESYWSIAGKNFRNKVFTPNEMQMPSGTAVLTPACIFRRDFLLENNISWSQTPGAAFQDQGFWFKTYTLANKCMYIADAFYRYRMDNINSSIYSQDSVQKITNEYKLIKQWIDNACPEKNRHFAKSLYWKAYFTAATILITRNFKSINLTTIKPFIDDFICEDTDVSTFSKEMRRKYNLLINNPKQFCEVLKRSSIIKTYELYQTIKFGEISHSTYNKLSWYIKHVGIFDTIKYYCNNFFLRYSRSLKRFNNKIIIRFYKRIIMTLPFSKLLISNNNRINKFFLQKPHKDYKDDYMFWLSEMHRQNVDNIRTAQLNYFKSMPKATGSLRERQENYLRLLSKLKKVLDEQKLNFWPMGGTLIGAVRHNGFVPWDDDIDISMYYNDKEKLFNAVSNTPDLKIFEVYWCHGTNTFLRCPRVVFKDLSEGDACIDIFLWEQANYEPEGYRPLWIKRNAATQWMIREYLKIRPKLNKKQYINEEIVDFHDRKLIENIFNEGRKMCINSIGTSKNGDTFYGCVDMLYERGRWLAVYKKTTFEPFISGTLEDIQIDLPNDYDKMLCDQYGSWLSLPTKVTPNHGG